MLWLGAVEHFLGTGLFWGVGSRLLMAPVCVRARPVKCETAQHLDRLVKECPV
jgi:hypothetical protein